MRNIARIKRFFVHFHFILLKVEIIYFVKSFESNNEYCVKQYELNKKKKRFFACKILIQFPFYEYDLPVSSHS